MFFLLCDLKFDAIVSFSDPGKDFNPAEVLVAMREYVRYFLGCRDCASHFVNMANNVEYDVRNGSDGVLWLWRSHNLVNQRLQGDHTEDPQHPKIQWPSIEACPRCWQIIRGRYGSAVRWKEAEVLSYLLEFYSANNIEGDTVSTATRTPTAPTTLHGILTLFLLLIYSVLLSL